MTLHMQDNALPEPLSQSELLRPTSLRRFCCIFQERIFLNYTLMAVSPCVTRRQLLTVNKEWLTNTTHSSCAGLKTNKPATLKLAGGLELLSGTHGVQSGNN